MKLRIARKLDLKNHDERRLTRWWAIYSSEQLRRAEVRLRKRWSRNHPLQTDNSNGRRYQETSPDWFAANRIEAQLIRQGAIRRMQRDGQWNSALYPDRRRKSGCR